jgi:uncharacterized OsmC-like protein
MLKSKKAVMSVSYSGGLKFSADVRGHLVLTDQPVEAGGDDSAASPLELIGVALGSCIALYVTRFCLARGISPSGLRVEVAQETAKSPHRVSRYLVQLTVPYDLPATYRTTVERVAQSCAVHNTLLHSPQIEIELQDGVRRAR